MTQGERSEFFGRLRYWYECSVPSSEIRWGIFNDIAEVRPGNLLTRRTLEQYSEPLTNFSLISLSVEWINSTYINILQMLDTHIMYYIILLYTYNIFNLLLLISH